MICQPIASLNVGPCAPMAVTRVCSGLIASGGRINETMIFPSLFLATSDRRTKPLQDGTNTMVFVCCTCSGSSAILVSQYSQRGFFILVECLTAWGQVYQQTHHTVERGLLSGPSLFCLRCGVESMMGIIRKGVEIR